MIKKIKNQKLKALHPDLSEEELLFVINGYWKIINRKITVNQKTEEMLYKRIVVPHLGVFSNNKLKIKTVIRKIRRKRFARIDKIKAKKERYSKRKILF